MPFDPTNPRFASPLAGITQDRLTGMMNQPQTKVFAASPQDSGTMTGSQILPAQTQLNQTMGMAKGGQVNDELAGVKDTIRAEFASRGLDFDRFISNPAVMDEVGKSIQSHGKNGDTILAHINPEEAQLLKEMGGSGDINPHTGLPQFAGADPSGSSVTSSNYGGVSRGLSGFGGGSSSPSGVSGGGFSSSTSGGGYGGYSSTGGGGFTSRTGGDGGGSLAAARTADRLSVSGYSADRTGGQTSLSPMGIGGGSLSMGQRDARPAQATRDEPSVASYDIMSGLPIGGTGDLSGLGQLATTPSFTAAPAIGAGPIDLGNTRPELSDINFSDMNAGMYQGATMPGGVSNFAAAPTDPGYTDIGLTAMRMAAGQGDAGTRDRRTGIGQGTEYNLAKLNEFDPVAQTQGATILNRMMDEGYSPGFDQFGVGRTMAQQAALYNAADGNLTAAPGRSMHNFGLAMDVENLNDQGYRDLARIAAEEGWGWGGSADPAHVQMAPWGAGAMQTAQRLGAQPFTGAPTPQMATSSSPLREALNTASDIASELFGVKSAAAAEQPQNTALDNLFRSTEPFGGEEIMSPFVSSGVAGMAFPPQSQQQMLDVLGIAGQPVAPAPTQQQVLDALGIRGPIMDTGLMPGQKYQDRAPGAESLPTAYPSYGSMSAFGYPEQMATYGAPVAVGDITPALTSFDLMGATSPERQAAVAEAAQQMDETGTPYPQTELDPNSYQNYTLNPEFAYQKMLSALGWKSMFAPSQEEAIAKMTSALERAGSQYDPTTGTLYAQDPATMQKALGAVPIELKDSDGNIVGTINAADFLTPVATPTRTVPLPPTRMVEAPATPVAAPQTGLTGFEAALGSTPVTAPLTRGITPPAAAPAAGLSRQEPADPTQSTSPMTADQLRAMGIYRDTLQPGETIRQDFNAAYADATKRGIETFEWTNPKTGATSVYKSGADEADLPASAAKPAKGQQAPQTEYEKTVATLEDAGQIANGMSKEEYAEAMGVPVEEVKTRITTQFGPPMAEYYTKTVLESLAGMTGGKTNMEGAANLLSLFSPLGILSIAGKNIYNQYMKKPEEKADGGYISPLASMGKR